MTVELKTIDSIDGQDIWRAVLENGNGVRAGIIAYGAALQFLSVPSRTQAPVHLASASRRRVNMPKIPDTSARPPAASRTASRTADSPSMDAAMSCRGTRMV